jgi:hypothetical protein
MISIGKNEFVLVRSELERGFSTHAALALVYFAQNRSSCSDLFVTQNIRLGYTDIRFCSLNFRITKHSFNGKIASILKLSISVYICIHGWSGLARDCAHSHVLRGIVGEGGRVHLEAHIEKVIKHTRWWP